jgi:quercetin dioxygenase-like cupin family protein
MKFLSITAGLILAASTLQAAEGTAVVATSVLSASVTASGQPIALPQGNVQVVVSTLEIAPGALLPEHKHPFQRYAYVLAGTLRVSNSETGKSEVYKPGDFIVEALGQWHQGGTFGTEPVKLLVIDQIEKDQSNVVLRE